MINKDIQSTSGEITILFVKIVLKAGNCNNSDKRDAKLTKAVIFVAMLLKKQMIDRSCDQGKW